MSKRKPNRQLANDLASAAAAYQTAAVIPHCTRCAKPCCRLDTLVLELEWKQLKSFWHLEASRNAFDKRLNSGKGPEEIRAGNGLYYIHSKPCPAYDEAGASCRFYGQALKPQAAPTFRCMKIRGASLLTFAAKRWTSTRWPPALPRISDLISTLTSRRTRNFHFWSLCRHDESPERPATGNNPIFNAVRAH